MIQKGLIKSEKFGRHKYLSLVNSEVASIIESLLCLTPHKKPNSLKEVTRSKEIYYARTCYDHLAGTLGVEITHFLKNENYLSEMENTFELTNEGEKYLTNIGIDIEIIKKKRRSFSCKCLDWSERKFHLAGALGNSILEHVLEHNWIEKTPSTRAVKVTIKGKKEFKKFFGVEI